jgi:MFS family permease
MGSYVPLLLVHLDYSPLFTGIAVSVAGVGGIVGSVVVGRADAVRQRLWLPVMPVIVGGGLVAMVATGSSTVLTLAALFAVGVASGAQRILSPAIASDAVAPAEKGDALVITGTFRAASLVAAPALVAAAIPPLGLVWAMAVAGAALGATSLPTALLLRHDGPKA